MTAHFVAHDPDANGIGIYQLMYVYSKFTSFSDVPGTLSQDAAATQYAFTGANGASIVLTAAGGWSVDPDTGAIDGELTSLSFGQHTSLGEDGLFQHATELEILGVSISDPAELAQVFGAMANGELWQLDTLAGFSPRTMTGSDSKDSFMGTSQADVLFGGAGDDRLYGRGGDDRLVGGTGNDSLRAWGSGENTLLGGAGDDTVKGAAGDDLLLGGTGNDWLTAGVGNDRVLGGAGDDQIQGWRGHDTLLGGTGDDTLTGWSGMDTFVISADGGDDVITDFKPGKAGKDVIVFQDVGLEGFIQMMMSGKNIGDDLTVSYEGGSLTLKDVNLSSLDPRDFVFL